MYTTSFLLGRGTHVQISGFKINCTADPSGNFVEEQPGSGLIPFCFNCDIATSMLRHANSVYSADL